MYYLFERLGVGRPCRWIGRYPRLGGVFFDEGTRITGDVPDPLEVTLKPLNPDAADHGPEIPEYFPGRVPLFRDDLIEAMRRGGVDNMDVYNAVLIDPDSGRRHTTHKAVNIVGLISAADMTNSNATVHPGGPLIDVDFHGLVVDEAKAQGALVFRLAESTRAVLVHERLRDHLLASGFDSLDFLPPDRVAL